MRNSQAFGWDVLLRGVFYGENKTICGDKGDEGYKTKSLQRQIQMST